MRAKHACGVASVQVRAGGDGLVPRAGTGRCWLRWPIGSARPARCRLRARTAGRHDPGRVMRDLVVMLAAGGDCPADLSALPRPEDAVWAGRIRRDGLAADTRCGCRFLHPVVDRRFRTCPTCRATELIIQVTHKATIHVTTMLARILRERAEEVSARSQPSRLSGRHDRGPGILCRTAVGSRLRTAPRARSSARL